MNGIILINKDKDITSRDVVNIVSRKLNTKKIGHAGTLDPIATGLMIIGVGKGTKILDLLTLNSKEYIATVKIGIQTDTFDITGNIIKENKDYNLTKEKLLDSINKMIGTYNQVVPKYSAVKINGKRLYEYARNNIEIELPKREVTIYNIELLEFNESEFKFKTLVSKGCYIRSLINDIGDNLNIPMTMKELVRTKSGKFKLEDSNNIETDYNIISIQDALDYKTVIIKDSILLKRIKNGNIIELECDDDYITLVDINNNILGIYKKDINHQYKAFKILEDVC